MPAPVVLEERPPFWWLRWVPALVLTVGALYLLYVVGKVAVVPVLASFALAYVINPLVESFERRKLSRAFAALAALTVVMLVLAGFLWFVIPDLWTEAVGASDAVLNNLTPENAKKARAYIHSWSPLLDSMVGHRVQNFLRSPEPLLQLSQSFLAGSLTDFLATAANALDLLLIPFFVYYILVDFQHWRTSFDGLIPPRFQEPLGRLFDEVGRILQSYVLGQLMIAIVMGVLYAIGFAALQVPAWAGLAALSGLLNVVPYVGTGLGLILATGFTFAHGAETWRVLCVPVIFVIVQTVEGYYLTPRILGGRLALHPMAVFLGLLIGGRLFGFLGFLLAVPVIAVCHVFIKFLREIYKQSDFYRMGQIGPEPAPALVQDVMSKAADTVLASQVDKQDGGEVLAPSQAEEDQVALHRS